MSSTTPNYAAQAIAAGRDQTIHGYITLAIFLERHRDVPVPNVPGTTEHLILLGPDEDMIAEVDRIAAILAVTPQWRGGRYVARREFSDTVAYEAHALPKVFPAPVPAAELEVAAA